MSDPPRANPSGFEELDYQQTELGELILRRRRVASLGGAEVFEVKLDGAFLMSSLVNVAEIALATEALKLVEGDACDVLVGGLGLGYTAQAALDSGTARSVVVVEFLESVIEWHRMRLVPLGNSLCEDARCELASGDFFDAVMSSGGESILGERRFHAILLDIDHSPRSVLRPEHARFYTPEGLKRLVERLHPGGVFAVWSADPAEEGFLDALRSVFAEVRCQACVFQNPLLNEEDTNYIYLATWR
jgi:spermidine synthase